MYTEGLSCSYPKNEPAGPDEGLRVWYLARGNDTLSDDHGVLDSSNQISLCQRTTDNGLRSRAIDPQFI